MPSSAFNSLDIISLLVMFRLWYSRNASPTRWSPIRADRTWIECITSKNCTHGCSCIDLYPSNYCYCLWGPWNRMTLHPLNCFSLNQKDPVDLKQFQIQNRPYDKYDEWTRRLYVEVVLLSPFYSSILMLTSNSDLTLTSRTPHENLMRCVQNILWSSWLSADV